MKKWVILALMFLSVVARADTIEMNVYGLVCGFCAQGIEKTLRDNPATAGVIVSLENKLVAVVTKSGSDISDVELRKAITEAGYRVMRITRTQRSMVEIRDALRPTSG